MRTSELASKLCELDFGVQRVTPIASCPVLIFPLIPRALYPILSFFDKPLKRSRFTFIAGKKMRRARPIEKEKELEFIPFMEEEIKTIVQ
jgi:hypothetical protein